jgi:hypothetical protein
MLALANYLGTKGVFGKCPDDYALVQAAKYLGVAPWELMHQSAWWRIRALKFMNAEVEGDKIKAQRPDR